MLALPPLLLSLRAPSLQPDGGDAVWVTSPQSTPQSIPAVRTLELSRQNWFPHAPAAQRGLVVLKLARTGSTWLIEVLRASGAFCEAREEVTNNVFNPQTTDDNMKVPGSCTEAGEAIRDTLRCRRVEGLPEGMRAALSINPLKFNESIDLVMKMAGQRFLSMPPRNQTLLQRARTEAARSAALDVMTESGHENMTCRDEEVGAMQDAFPEPPLLVTLVRNNWVQQGASHIFARDLKKLVRPTCNTFHVNPHICNETEMEMASQPIPFDPAELLEFAQVYEVCSSAVRKIGREIADQLGTELFHMATEDMLDAGGNTSFALPPRLVEFLGLPQDKSYDSDEVAGRDEKVNKNPHEVGEQEAKLRGTIENFHEVRAYFEKHADAEYVKMLKSPI